MAEIPAAMSRQVRARSMDRCEYCGLSQFGQEATFHIDHIVPQTDGAMTILENLAVACVSCSLRKGARRTATDLETGKSAALYHPRKDRWHDHFRWESAVLVGTTETGRATVDGLQLNRARLVAIREQEIQLGRHPPPDIWPPEDVTPRSDAAGKSD